MTFTSGDLSASTLATLPIGVPATLGTPQVRSTSGFRLLEMGLTEGTSIQVVRRAPGNGPLEVHVRGTRLTLREEDARAFPVVADTDLPVKGPSEATVRIGVVGNPNCGKTTLFNRLTGLDAKTGNYPGITVEHREGTVNVGPTSISLIDLPGTYSLVPRAEDEALTVRAILGLIPQQPRLDALLYVLDATALERHLYFLFQLKDLSLPIVVAVTMMDVLEDDGRQLDLVQLADRLGMVVERAEDLQSALPALVSHLDKTTADQRNAEKRSPVARDLGFVTSAAAAAYVEEISSRQAGSLLSGTEKANEIFANDEGQVDVNALPAAGDALQARVKDRYQLVSGVAKDIVKSPGLLARVTKSEALTTSIDAIALHPRIGPLLMVAVFGVLFQALFSWAGPVMDGVSGGVGAIGSAIVGIIPASLPLLRSLWLDGLVAGVGNVLVFVPQIFILFFALGVLEDTGYLARAAFLLDRLMARVGLHGRAFVPLLSGFACAVPAVMAARTIENEKDRLVTILVTPLVSCSARLPVYSLVIGTLFATSPKLFGIVHPGTVLMFSMYALGLIAAIGMAALFKRTLLKSRTPDLVMELPPYRMPHLASLLKHTFGRVRVFLIEAGTIILALTVVLWALFNFPRDAAMETKAATEIAQLQAQHERAQKAVSALDPLTAPSAQQKAATTLVADLEGKIAARKGRQASVRVEGSLAGTLGKGIAPLVAPLGFDWKMGVGLVASFAAREVLVSSLGLVYGLGDGLDDESVDLRKAMRDARDPKTNKKVYTPLVGLSLMVFFVLAMQCMSTLAAVRRETGGWKWPLFQFGYMTALAYAAALMVFQIGRLLGFGG